MELIKDIIKQFYPLLIMFSCLFFVIYIFFSAGEDSAAGVFENAGAAYHSMLEDDDLKNEGLSYIGDASDGYVPLIKYHSKAKEVGDCVNFKSLFLVQKKDGSFVNGALEDDFAIYLLDIKNEAGNSVLMRMSSEELEGLEEIPAAFIYDEEQAFLHMFESGNYIVYLKIYGHSGGFQMYEFKLPVEAA